jgi:uncharacterized protein YacL
MNLKSPIVRTDNSFRRLGYRNFCRFADKKATFPFSLFCYLPKIISKQKGKDMKFLVIGLIVGLFMGVLFLLFNYPTSAFITIVLTFIYTLGGYLYIKKVNKRLNDWMSRKRTK